MSEYLERIASFGPLLFVGTTALLAAGCVAIRLTSVPIRRQRLGELTVAAALAWMVLAVTPFPRLLPWSGRRLEAKAVEPFESSAIILDRVPAPSVEMVLDADLRMKPSAEDAAVLDFLVAPRGDAETTAFSSKGSSTRSCLAKNSTAWRRS